MANLQLKDLRSNHGRLYLGACLVLALTCAFLVVHEIYGSNGYLTLRRQRKEYHATQQRIQQLEQEKSELEEQVRGLKSDPKTIERVAREKMHLARPGEIIYALPDQDSKTQNPSTAQDQPQKR